jgi:hypothetical protein
MGVNYNPKIVTDGLTFAYDGTNPRSGSSKELISGSSGSVYSYEIQFNSNSLTETMWSSVASNAGPAPAPGTGFSVNLWTKRTANTIGSWEEICLIDVNPRMMWFGYYNNQTARFHCSFPYYNASNVFTYWSVDPYFSDAGIEHQVNVWYNVCITYNNSTRLLSTYINTNFALSGTRPGTGDLIRPINSPNSNCIRIFGAESSTLFENNRTGLVSFYNRALTVEEIKQNFNALRGRYGI